MKGMRELPELGAGLKEGAACSAARSPAPCRENGLMRKPESLLLRNTEYQRFIFTAPFLRPFLPQDLLYVNFTQVP